MAKQTTAAPTGEHTRLSKSLRKHIRDLKAAGRRDEAAALRKAALKKQDDDQQN